MSPTKHKPKKPATVNPKSAGPRWPWSVLPPINLTRSRNTVRRDLHFLTATSATKSWLPARSPRCKSTERRSRWPQLQRLTVGDGPAESPRFRGPRNRYLGDATCIGDLPEELILAYSGHWCILRADLTRSCSPPRLPPPYPENPVLEEVMLDRNGGVPSSGIVARYVTHTRNRYDYVRIRHECATMDPFDANKKYMEFVNLVRCEGKVYAVSLQGTLVVMEDVNSRLRITAISATRAVPSVSSRFFEEYLLEVNGEVFLAFIIHQKSLETVDQVEVFRLCFVKLKWIRVGGLEGKTLFLGQSCFWVNSGEVGCRGDCVYFRKRLENVWWMYDVKSGCISLA